MEHKLSKIQSKEIYELAKDPNNKLSEPAIAKRYGVAVNNVRYHIAKWEKEFGDIAKNSVKLQDALIDHTIDVLTESHNHIIQIENSIKHAEEIGVSPDRLSGLYNCRSRAFEFYCELKGDIQRDTNVNVLNAVQVNQQESDKKFDRFIARAMQEKDQDFTSTIDNILGELSEESD